jgi:hypothetical protein
MNELLKIAVDKLEFYLATFLIGGVVFFGITTTLVLIKCLL